MGQAGWAPQRHALCQGTHRCLEEAGGPSRSGLCRLMHRSDIPRRTPGLCSLDPHQGGRDTYSLPSTARDSDSKKSPNKGGRQPGDTPRVQATPLPRPIPCRATSSLGPECPSAMPGQGPAAREVLPRHVTPVRSFIPSLIHSSPQPCTSVLSIPTWVAKVVLGTQSRTVPSPGSRGTPEQVGREAWGPDWEGEGEAGRAPGRR